MTANPSNFLFSDRTTEKDCQAQPFFLPKDFRFKTLSCSKSVAQKVVSAYYGIMIHDPDTHAIQLEVFPDRLCLRRSDPDRNMKHFYLMTVQRDLFGGASLVREWGRIGSASQLRVEHHPDEGQAVDALAEIAKAKRKRGYHITRTGL